MKPPYEHSVMLARGGSGMFRHSASGHVQVTVSISEQILEGKMRTDWIAFGTEPSLHDVMADPILALLMQSDRIEPRDVFAAIEKARPTWKAGGAKRSLTGRPSEQYRDSNDDQHPLCRLSRLCEGLLPVTGTAVALAVLLVLIPL